MRPVIVVFGRGVVRHRFLLFVALSRAVSGWETQTAALHYRQSPLGVQRHALESCGATWPTGKRRLASANCGHSSMKRGRTWPARARTVRTADGMKGRLMGSSIGSSRSIEPRKRTPALRITPQRISSVAFGGATHGIGNE